MKKLLFFLYILIFSFSFFVFTDWISNKQEESMRLAGKKESFIFTINENVLKTDSKNFLLLLRIASDEYEANIFKSVYSEDSSTEYIYLTHDIKSYFSNFSLLNGILPNNNKENDFYLSTLQNKEITGKIFSYKKDINFNIRPLKSYPMDKSIGGKYIVSLKDQTKIHSFINRLQNDFGIPIKYSIYEIQPTIES
ncbi:bacteriocin-associated protein, partial [Bacillus mobilis]